MASIPLLNTIPPRNPETSLELSEIDPAQLTVDDCLSLATVHAGDCARHDERCTGTMELQYERMGIARSVCRTCKLLVISTLTQVTYSEQRTKD
jgi:hypothetical protein